MIILPIRYFLIQPFYVKGASMEPNFFDHEYLIIDEINYRFKAPTRGDVIVFRYPKDPQEYFIKRIVGLPGERVQFKDGDVYVYNQQNPQGLRLDDSYLTPGIKTYGLSEDPVDVGTDDFFVLGDNRMASKDSRSFGSVNRSFFIGRVVFRGWPFDRAGIIK